MDPCRLRIHSLLFQVPHTSSIWNNNNNNNNWCICPRQCQLTEGENFHKCCEHELCEIFSAKFYTWTQSVATTITVFIKNLPWIMTPCICKNPPLKNVIIEAKTELCALSNVTIIVYMLNYMNSVVLLNQGTITLHIMCCNLTTVLYPVLWPCSINMLENVWSRRKVFWGESKGTVIYMFLGDQTSS